MIRTVKIYDSNAVSKNEFILVEMEKTINDFINNSSFNKKRIDFNKCDYVEAIELSILAKETKEVYIFSRNTEVYNKILKEFITPKDLLPRSLLINGNKPRKGIPLISPINPIKSDAAYTEIINTRKTNFIQLAYDNEDISNEIDSKLWIDILKKEYDEGVFIWFHEDQPFRKELIVNGYEISLFLFLRCNISFISSERVNVTKFLPIQKIKDIASSLDMFDPGNEITEYFRKIAIEKSFNSLQKFFSSTTKELLSQATRAAISQVMARNLSHNIGSHVMNKLIGDLRNLGLLDLNNDKTSYKSFPIAELHNEIKMELEKIDWYINSDEKLKYKAFQNEIALKLISDFNSYVKCRMDYLADLTFGTPAMLSNKKAYIDIFADLDKVRLLLDNISGRGDQFKYRICFKINGCNLDESNDFPIAIPNDVLGCQAFYNIIENVIRNTAKHATASNINAKVFTVNFRDIKDGELDTTNTELCDNAQTFYCVEIYDNITIVDIDKLVADQNKKIDDPVLDNENKLRGQSLGMIEMDASAAYLRQMEIVEVDSDEYKIDTGEIYNLKGKFNILKAFSKDGCLGYRFFLKKPQEVLIVTDKNINNKELIKNGIWTTTIENFKQHLEQDKNYNHEFLVLEDNMDLKKLVDEKQATVTRKVYFKTAVQIEQLMQKHHEEIKRILWKWREEELYTIYTTLGKRVNGKSEIIGLPKLNNQQSDFANHLYEIANATNPFAKWKEKCEGYFYYEGLSSKAQSILPDFNNIVRSIIIDNERIPKYLEALNDPYENYTEIRLKIAESILSKIIVLDERIQDKLNDELYKISYAEHFRMSGIIVPDKTTIELKADKIEIKDIESFIEQTIQSTSYTEPVHPQIDSLLIHYSLLERAYEMEKETNHTIELDKKDWVYKKLGEMSEKLNIVVTSGRGNIQGLPNKVRFLNLSVITTALLDIKSKYLIHNIVCSSRTT